MIQKIWFILGIFLTFLIFIQMPEEDIGLTSIASKTDLLGSPKTAESTIKIFTGFCILVYLSLTFFININI